MDQESSTQDKLGLYRTLFAGRSDVYAYRWENAADGTKGWSPKRRPGTTRDNPEYLPLTDDIITAHLTKDNPAACGLYVMLTDSTCRLLVCDFDGGTWRLDAAAYAEAAAWAGVPAAIEISRSGEGAHVWTFFAEPVAAVDARAMGAALLREAMAIRGEMGMESYDRFFPAQDYLPRRGFGNLIALPLEGTCRKNGTTLFVDPATFKPFEDQFAFLSSTERMTRRDVVERAEELQPPMVGPAVWLHRSPLAEDPPPPEVIKAELSGMLAIRRAGLPPSLLSSLKHLASLHNPEFYSRQQIGLSVWGAPRMLRCYEESLDRLLLPRGVADRAAQLIEKAGSRLVITDLRSAPAELEVTFSGTLRAEQRVAVDAVAAHELGVLVAPPGAGKTVMGCSVIARHQVPTLVLVDRTPLVDQWKERLCEHLGLGPKEIGQLGGGKKTKLTGRIDLATLQALTRADDPAKILSEYGLVIVDECHHVAAKTFAAAIRSIPARRWLGLTATPRRPDRREEIMFMHCGPVRHKIPSETNLVQELHVHPTATTIREDIDSDTPGILQSIIIPALVSDRTRTAQIVDDVVRAIRRGRNCLVMAGRTEHVDLLAAEITSRGLAPMVLHGSVPPRQRRAILKRLADWDPRTHANRFCSQRPPATSARGSTVQRSTRCSCAHRPPQNRSSRRTSAGSCGTCQGRRQPRYMTTPTPACQCSPACMAGGSPATKRSASPSQWSARSRFPQAARWPSQDPRCPHPRPPGRGSPAEWHPSRPRRSGHGRRNTASTSPTGVGYAPRSGSNTTPPIRHDRQRLGRKSHCSFGRPAWVCGAALCWLSRGV